MDVSSWLPFQDGGTGGSTARYDRSCGGSGLHQEQDVPISSPVEQRLKQIYLLMDMEEHGHATPAPSSSSSSSSAFRSFSGSPDEISWLMLAAASTTATTPSCHHPVEASSQHIPLSPIAYGDHHGHCYGNVDTIPDLDDFMCQEVPQEQAQRRNGHGSGGGGGGAFRPYVRHLSPKKKPKPGSGDQKVIKSAMSALARMHMVRLAQWRQCYQMEMAAAQPPTGSNCNQLQHVLSERKRREKLNDSFKALKTVLPPGSKKDKASILIRAREYVNTLKSRVFELEEKNKMLVESWLHRDNGDEQDDYFRQKIEVDISRTAAEETSQEFHLKIVVRSGCSAMDAVVAILRCLKEIGDVRLVSMDTGSSSGLPLGNAFQQATITLQLKSSICDDDFVKEYIIKTVKGVMQTEIETT